MRSSNRLSWVLAIVGILFVIVFLMLQKRQFKWETNYSTYSDEPFGCQLFDSIMSSSCTQGYEVVDTRLDSILLSPKWKRHLVMEICDLAELNLTPKLVLDFVRDGGVFLLASEYWNAEFVWSLNASFKRDDSNIHIGQPVEGEFQQVVFKQSATYPEHTYTLSSSLCDYYLTPSDPADTVLFTKDIIKAKKYNLKWSDHVFLKTSQKPVVSTASYGKGQIILCSMPMLFTNYGIMESDNFGLIMRIVSLAGKKKIVRTDETHRFELPNIENPIQEGETPIMDHILNNQALQTAFYLTLAGLLIFFIFNSRRRQRIIPVIKAKTNGQLNFVKQIGSLYYRNGSSDSIIRKKYAMLMAEIKKKVRTESDDPLHSHTDLMRIAAHTGLTLDEVRQVFQRMDSYLRTYENTENMLRQKLKTQLQKQYRGTPVDEKVLESQLGRKMPKTSNRTMVELVDLMNRISERL